MTAVSAVRVLIVEDEALVAAEIEFIVEEVGLRAIGIAVDLDGAADAIRRDRPDLVLLDVHLADGPTGLDVARLAAENGCAVLFMTANRRRLPADFAGAIGAVAKPYTEWGMRSALKFVAAGLGAGKAIRSEPSSLELAPDWARRWAVPSAV